MASRVRSDTLRAPVTEQIRLRAEYSSSESRTLIIRVRGFRTVMSDSDAAQRFWTAFATHKCMATDNWRRLPYRGLTYVDRDSEESLRQASPPPVP
jgi:hypothetical protein